MMIKVMTATLSGVSGAPVTVETDLHQGMPEFHIVGLADTTIRESCRRIRPAILNSGFRFPGEKLTVNLMPAARPKEGSHFDLPIAMGIILLTEGFEPPGDTAFLGELSLDGQINPVRGVLPLVISLRRQGIRKVILPLGNAAEASVLDDIGILGAESLREVVDHVTGMGDIPLYKGKKQVGRARSSLDFAQVYGQESVKRAMVIGAAGGHGMLMMGSPGCGKTMIARRLPTILPELTYEEKLEIMAIYSVAGLLDQEHPAIGERPFRNPHHSITMTGLIGGGAKPRPGELSLAHRGVLFLDELGEFDSRVIDSMRQPIEDGFVRINRNLEEIIFPSDVMVVIASNPCKCGNLWDERKLCTCTPRQLMAHRRKLSGPFTDRIDMHIRMMPVDKEMLKLAQSDRNGLTSDEMRRQVEQARQRQLARYADAPYDFNAGLDEKGLACFCGLDRSGRQMMMAAYDRMALTMRGYVRIVKLARTIADLADQENIREEHIAEALTFRTIGTGGEEHGQ